MHVRLLRFSRPIVPKAPRSTALGNSLFSHPSGWNLSAHASNWSLHSCHSIYQDKTKSLQSFSSCLDHFVTPSSQWKHWLSHLWHAFNNAVTHFVQQTCPRHPPELVSAQILLPKCSPGQPALRWVTSVSEMQHAYLSSWNKGSILLKVKEDFLELSI